MRLCEDGLRVEATLCTLHVNILTTLISGVNLMQSDDKMQIN